jgi:pimeloyl-ACP methyl ester carboxylesterase
MLDRAEILPRYLLVASSAGGLTAELYARQHPAKVSGLIMLDALSGNMVRELPELDALSSISCRARMASWFGLPRLLDPLQLRRLPENERARVIAFTYRTRTLEAVCSQTSSFAQSAEEIAAAPALPRELPVVVITHDDFEGVIPGASREQLTALEPRWQALQRDFAGAFSGGEYQSAHSRHLIANERPELVVAAIEKLAARIRQAAPADRYPGAGSP